MLFFIFFFFIIIIVIIIKFKWENKRRKYYFFSCFTPSRSVEHTFFYHVNALLNKYNFWINKYLVDTSPSWDVQVKYVDIFCKSYVFDYFFFFFFQMGSIIHLINSKKNSIQVLSPTSYLSLMHHKDFQFARVK